MEGIVLLTWFQVFSRSLMDSRETLLTNQTVEGSSHQLNIETEN